MANDLQFGVAYAQYCALSCEAPQGYKAQKHVFVPVLIYIYVDGLYTNYISRTLSYINVVFVRY